MTSATDVSDSTRVHERLRAQAEDYVSALESDAPDRGLDVETVVRDSVLIEEIVAYAEEHGIDAIVMGTDGRGGVERLPGSVTDEVIRTAPVPVLSVRGNEDESNPRDQ
jgi:nucleotide-binding universal stress UspA family protein